MEVKILGLKIGTARGAESVTMGYVLYHNFKPYPFMERHIKACDLGVNFLDGDFEIYGNGGGGREKSLDIYNLMVKVC